MPPAPLKLRPYGALQICLLLLHWGRLASCVVLCDQPYVDTVASVPALEYWQRRSPSLTGHRSRISTLSRNAIRHSSLKNSRILNAVI